MAKTVGLSRNLKLPWLNQMTSILSENLSEKQIRERLNEYLKFEIYSPTNLRKTREILMKIWFHENAYSGKLRKKAFSLISQFPECALELHWCMMLAAYPIFKDMCRLLGGMAEFQEEIITAQLKQKIFDEWGERSTLRHSVDKLMATMKAFHVLTSNGSGGGKYFIRKHRVPKDEVVSFMVYTAMNIDGSAYYPLHGIDSFSYLFPFSYHMRKEALLQDERFNMYRFGGELSIGLRERP